jgi:hypothetical protein
LLLERGPQLNAEFLETLAKQGEQGRQGLVALAYELGTRKKRWPLRSLVKCCADSFKRDTETWARIGAAFGAANDDAALAEWMADWAGRSDEQPWMLVNLAIALRGIGHEEEARQVSEHALTLPRDYTSAFHEVWLCLDDAFAGDLPALDDRLQKLPRAELDPFHAFVAALVDALKQMQEADLEDRDGVFHDLRGRLAQAASESEPVTLERALYRSYRDCVRHLAAMRGGLFATLWGMWRRCRPLLPKAKMEEVRIDNRS